MRNPCRGSIVNSSSSSSGRKAKYLRIGQPKNKSHFIHFSEWEREEKNFRGSFILSVHKTNFLPLARRLVTHRTISFDFVFVCALNGVMWNLFYYTFFSYSSVCANQIEKYWLFIQRKCEKCRLSPYIVIAYTPTLTHEDNSMEIVVCIDTDKWSKNKKNPEHSLFKSGLHKHLYPCEIMLKN